jgi:hypothetical protein
MTSNDEKQLAKITEYGENLNEKHKRKGALERP